MSCSTKPVLNALYTPNVCLISLPTNFNPKILNPYLSIPSKLIKLHTSYSLSPPLSSFSLKNNTRSTTVLPFVAQTSEWAQQEEENPVIGGEEQGFSWGGEVEDDEGAVEAIGDAGENSEEGETYPEPPEDAKIFVGNLAYDVDSERLAQLFEQGGVVEIAEVIYNRATDQSRGFGFVTMSTVEEADKAVDMFHQYELNGRLLTVNKAAPRGSRTESPPRVFEPAYRMYVGNLPWSVDNARLEQVVREHGKVVDARVLYDRDTGRSRGFGFVTMSTEEELNDAIAKLDGQNLDGRTIKVNVAEERPRRSF